LTAIFLPKTKKVELSAWYREAEGDTFIHALLFLSHKLSKPAHDRRKARGGGGGSHV
jgi:hypothetical protein